MCQWIDKNKYDVQLNPMEKHGSKNIITITAPDSHHQNLKFFRFAVPQIIREYTIVILLTSTFLTTASMKLSLVVAYALASIAIAAPITGGYAEGVDLVAPRIGYKAKRRYPELAENPTQVTSAEGVDLVAPRIGYKAKRRYPELAENPTQVTSAEGVDLVAPRIGVYSTNYLESSWQRLTVFLKGIEVT
ncbi:TPA_exp: Uncharacterized protein A8136_0924 [Trichophyton benhamiae CBS 112371]|uniref:Uncharacterized protein n=1 Tax=Arthroderma benhamiae (strain ATCC MYA-4681 / CBS 112371) TaxID=663331 RepID=D4AUN5_ARTBC|nr:uncharacterized protein ARB_07952 [Trichophyton benhamiae CBS 112371]EFE33200.1 hypothetical protein ARB_07952 [Trichophyton benhamiae CBS 112371]DAA76252.1 TPA_exp: Uncharacterized protein A8136_0924 [Trichophyton benhamiae CBS 112371]